jgi:RNA polymerase sigma-70 factor (ECF subfamily)
VVMLEDQHCQELMEEDNYVNIQAMQEKMIRALDELKPDDLELIELRVFEGYSYKEIADLLDISLSNAKVKMHRIITRLKKQLNG